ncbi:probable serine/threonine-protein kinase PBL11 isoform X2 [Rhodamnia argentea]|uniref:Probable serine/threonine-protein kinase PBL11 isoform X2 n=1 Tax=Rhodamnia argentea TaxID=178133 RepID=A0A8B8PPX7_9MYRT|nr:probable serine/threonine-protein kinase PBL11 isoform X2 [Rhodamnia argentea]
MFSVSFLKQSKAALALKYSHPTLCFIFLLCSRHFDFCIISPFPGKKKSERKMGGSQETCTDTEKPRNESNAPTPISHHHADHQNESQIKTLLRKMVLDFGLSCLRPSPKKQSRDEAESGDKGGHLENNRAWLLAESTGGGRGPELANADPQSVHSSFRFTFCSRVELEPFCVNASAVGTTVLMLNLDNGLDECDAQEVKWRRVLSLEKNIAPVANTLIRFVYSEILSATRNFSKGRVLGRGALSCVFRGRVGYLRTAVAIKRLDREDKESPKAFFRELMIASSLHHPNIVPLLGFCIDPEEGLFLVYKYVSGGSLEQHLHNRKKGGKVCPTLPWLARYKVAVGVAEAMMYLHNGTEKCVVHRDIKPSNILLSSKKKPKLCDFGLATWTSGPSVPFLCKTVKGTFGYLAPEYFQHGKVSDKTDVYAFGVVLLELITGRKPIEANKPAGEENLVLWAKPLLQKGVGAIQELLDPRLGHALRSSSPVLRLIQAAHACINSEESQRPPMDRVVAILRGEEEPSSLSRKGSAFVGNGCIIDFYSHQLQQSKTDMDGHLALAMLGVPDIEDDDLL